MIEYVHCSIDRLTILAEDDRPLSTVKTIRELLSKRLANKFDVVLVDYQSGSAFGIAHSEWDEDRLEDMQENLIFINAFQKGRVSDVRIDFNPNALVKHEVEYVWTELKYILSLLRLNLRLSRFDLAFDIINAPEIQKMQNIKGGVTRKEWYSRIGALQTVYWGSQASAVQIRLYDKKAELGGILGLSEYAGIGTDDYGRYKIEIQDLWRLEMQMRTKVINENLVQEVEKRLDDFSLTSPYSLDLKPELFPFAAIFLSEPGDIALAYRHVPERTIRDWKAKVRKAVREVNDEYVETIKKALQRDTEKLCQELKKYCDVYLGF